MKILHISYSDEGGGAAIGARRIHEALLEQGVDSKMLCAKPSMPSSRLQRAFGPVHSKFIGLVNRISWRFLNRVHRTGNKNLHSLSFMPSGLHRIINRSDADIVNLHWVNNEMISIREIAKIRKPIVWTLHDMWPISGASHNALDEYYARFESGYKIQRPKEDSWPDIDLWVWKRKQKHWKNFQPVFVAVSGWMADNVRKSALFPDASVNVIPNTIDIDVFAPSDKQNARKIFGLPPDKKIILFASSAGPYKGMDLMMEALRLYGERMSLDDFVAVAFGKEGVVDESCEELPVRFVGHIDDERELALLYSAADVTCVPSRVESFGQTAAESMACGTPAVVYDCSGLVDIVDHQLNGYVAEKFNPADFAAGIEWVLDRPVGDGRLLSCNAVKKAAGNFSSTVVASKYIKVYKSLLSL